MKTKDNAMSFWDLQGKLFLHNQIQQAFVRKNLRQKDEDYQLAPGLTVKDECSRAFCIAQASWASFKKVVTQQDSTPAAISEATRTFAQRFFVDVLDYKNWTNQTNRFFVEDGRGFVVTAFANGVPIVVAPGDAGLDEPLAKFAIENGSRSRKTAFQAVQEFLNASSEHLWGFCFNGQAVRLVRDAMSLTRPSYLEFNLEEIFTAQSFADFLQLWVVLHASRAKNIKGTTAWDLWIKAGEDSGQPVRDKLAEHVTKALQVLGNGFLKEKSNSKLRAAIAAGELSSEGYVLELLRLMYRFLFVFCLEERDLLNTPVDESAEDSDKVRIAAGRYQSGYALRRFRDPSTKNRFRTRYTDAWESVKIVFRCLERGEPALALPGLGGLFDRSVTPWLDQSQLPNREFFEAMELLRWATIEGVTTVIDYKNMGVEELGSVYEGLLELVPFVDPVERTFGFVGISNVENNRKSTGSYYTPDALVQSLIKTALDPVIADTIAKNPQNVSQALLNLRVIDPTCGSGHFLLAAARRIAEALAQQESPDGVVTPDSYREALRTVIQHCIYGVDINPLAIELARMALWLEGYSRGKPLSFLDHHLKVGNSVVGIGDLRQLSCGISNKAFKPQMGDDKAICARLEKANQNALKQRKKFLEQGEELSGNLFDETPTLHELSRIEAMRSESLDDEKLKAVAYEHLQLAMADNVDKQKCDLFMAAYLSPKNAETAKLVPTTENLLHLQIGNITENDRTVIEYASKFCSDNKVFHWPIEFEGVFAQGGFDCVLGNPPWEKDKVEDVKWFGYRKPMIAKAEKTDIRKQMIEALSQGNFEVKFNRAAPSEEVAKAEIALYRQYERAKQKAAVGAVYGHLAEKEGGRFPLTGHGDTNLYAYVSELAINIRTPSGSVGLVVPPGLVTDASYQEFAQKMLDGEISSFYQFDNTKKIFPIDARYSFSLITFRKSEKMQCIFYANETKHLNEKHRKVKFEIGDFNRFNPNTGTCLYVRTQEDLSLIRKLYQAAPILMSDGADEGNPWHIRSLRMFDMSLDSYLFKSKQLDLVPLYEGKYIHQFDHRFASCFGLTDKKGDLIPEEVPYDLKINKDYTVNTKNWITRESVKGKLTDRHGKCFWDKPWSLCYRKISSPTNQRTLLATVIPSSYGTGDGLPLLLPNVPDALAACLLANINSLCVDFVARIKQVGMNVNLFLLKQMPIFSPASYQHDDIEYICSRVALLTKNSVDMSDVWLLSHPVTQYQDPKSRLKIRAEIDAYFALLYGLSRKELQYILDPSAIFGDDWPSVTFSGLKRDEIAEFGEYLTQRLVLEAYDELSKSPRFNKVLVAC